MLIMSYASINWLLVIVSVLKYGWIVMKHKIILIYVKIRVYKMKETRKEVVSSSHCVTVMIFIYSSLFYFYFPWSH